MMQPRFERRVGNSPFTLVEQPRFRAGFDFLRLRADVGEVSDELARWWEAFSLADEDERRRLIESVRGRDARQDGKRQPKPALATDVDEELAAAAEPAKKRRRRRRKPAETGATAASEAGEPGVV